MTCAFEVDVGVDGETSPGGLRSARGCDLDGSSPRRSYEERWVTKQELADHLGVSRRWIELRQHIGLPYLRMGGINRYSVIEVEEWLREQYTATADPRSA